MEVGCDNNSSRILAAGNATEKRNWLVICIEQAANPAAKNI